MPDCYSDLFFCEVFDSKLKSDRCSLEFPLVELISGLFIGIIYCNSEACFLKLTSQLMCFTGNLGLIVILAENRDNHELSVCHEGWQDQSLVV